MNKKNWDDIRFVLTVARLGSLNAAAAKLGVTHATVMRRVAAFEASHDQKIFQKSPAGYKLLPEAFPILRSMEGIEEATISMERRIAGADQSPSGTVRIASTDSLCNLVLPSIVAKISDAFPKIEVSLLSANEHHDLGRLSADIAVRATNVLGDGLAGQSVGKLFFAAYSNGAPDQKWLKLEGMLAGSIAAGWLRDHVTGDQMTAGSDSFLVLQHLAACGLGKALLPEFVGDCDPSLARFDIESPPLGVQIWVASLKEFTYVPRILSVQKRLIKELQSSVHFGRQSA